MRCCLCAGTTWRRWYEEPPWEVWRCAGCGLGRTWPEPTPEDLERFYASEYYETHGMGGHDREAWRLRAQAVLDALPSRPASVLDFGAGEGQLVAAFRVLGLQVEGVEPNLAGRRAASERLGVRLLSKAPSAGEYDLVTAIHVLEHLPDPVVALRELLRCASPRAAVFIEVPNADSIDLWSVARRREILQLPGHLVHFTPQTAKRLVRAAGLEPLSVEVANPAALERLFAWRAQWQTRARRAQRAPHRDSASGSLSHRPGRALPGRGWRQYWAERVLPAVRRRLPGWRIQVVGIRVDGGR